MVIISIRLSSMSLLWSCSTIWLLFARCGLHACIAFSECISLYLSKFGWFYTWIWWCKHLVYPYTRIFFLLSLLIKYLNPFVSVSIAIIIHLLDLTFVDIKSHLPFLIYICISLITSLSSLLASSLVSMIMYIWYRLRTLLLNM